MIQMISAPIDQAILRDIAKTQFQDMVKAVVDIEKETMAIGGELHADEEAIFYKQALSKEISGASISMVPLSFKWVSVGFFAKIIT
ncbi:MAG: DUF5674 family protein, partial [Nitrospirota bacterium]